MGDFRRAVIFFGHCRWEARPRAMAARRSASSAAVGSTVLKFTGGVVASRTAVLPECYAVSWGSIRELNDTQLQR
jgi:hypothetical protein